MRVQIVSFHCVLKNNLGHLISSSFNQDVTTNPEDSEDSIPGFVEGLKGLKPGQRKKIFVSADRAYGFYQPKLSVELPRTALRNGRTLKVGDKVKGALTEDRHFRTFYVTAANPEILTLDGNHPLAGQDLVFDVEITASHEESDEPVSELFLVPGESMNH